MVETHPEQGREGLINELRERVESFAGSLEQGDAQLASALVSLLAHANRISRDAQASPPPPLEDELSDLSLHENIYDTLDRQVAHLKAQRVEGDETASTDAGARGRIERALLWNRIDQDLETVSRLCRTRIAIGMDDPFDDTTGVTNRQRSISPSLNLPPDYEYDYDLPEYQGRASYEYPPSFVEKYAGEKNEKQKPLTVDDTASIRTTKMDEKMRLELENITSAIDRLYAVAPQLHNQRVELRKGKLEELQRAANAAPSKNTPKSGQRSRSGSGGDLTGSTSKVKGKMKEDQELEEILQLIGKASSRRLDDQTVVMSEDLAKKLGKARDIDEGEVRSLFHSFHTRLAVDDREF